MIEKKPRRGRPAPQDRSTAPARDDFIEGRNPVLEALKANRPINKLLVSKGVGRHSIIGQILHHAKRNGVLVEYVDTRFIQKISPTGHSQGVVAMIATKSYVDLDDLLEASHQKNTSPLYVILDGIEDPQNLGAILRTADAAGVHGVIIPERRAVGLTAAVSRASAGAVEYVPVARVGNIAKTLTALQKQGIWTVGVDMEGDAGYTHADYDQAMALVIGAEGKGLSRLVKERCDLLVSIPMKGQIASLNASIAAALVMYEAARQRDRSSEGST
ncbi:MAG: 23S rRNA (guanosine(2251)-2'-O)-methyltransferase RlmB [SAR202 cluster bacterium]|nr:23S rRNA (guanosine(2251)-2'-O)-methyltransferase RlmB [SAR202 cluster bacterium]|tara:strand:- start:536 stop:1354 length:819 start_codon:yes stop_codon:yes gene_type:complete